MLPSRERADVMGEASRGAWQTLAGDNAETARFPHHKRKYRFSLAATRAGACAETCGTGLAKS